MSDDDCESSYNLQMNPDHDDESNRFPGLTAPTTPVKAFDIFRHVLRGSKNKEVSPLCCIPYSRIRGICRSGVTRLSKLFDSSASNLGYSQGHSSSASLPIVMEFDHMEKDFVVGFLVNERSMAITEAINRYNAHTVWYGIVDGVHRHEALLMNMENDPVKWGGYIWWVTVVQKQPQELLQAFARDRNEKQKKEYVVDFTIYDVLRNMKNVANSWEVRSGEQLINPQSGAVRHGVITEIAIDYCGGGGSATNTARQMAGVVIKLTEQVINEIGRIVNFEDSELAAKLYDKKSNKTKRIRIDSQLIDNRVFRTLFNTSTFRSATLFKSTPKDIDRVNALRRCRYIAEERESVKSFNGQELNNIVKDAMAARREIEKMNVVIGSEEWPPEMATTRSNILETTKLDEEIRTNTGEDRSVLPRLEELYLTYGGRSASQKLHLFRSGRLRAGRSTPLPNPRCAESPIPALFESTNMNANESSSIVRGQASEPTNTNANGESELGDGTIHENDLEINGYNIYALRKLNISTFNISWESYRDTIIHSQERLQVDMILTDPPYQLPSSRVPTGHGYDDSIDDIDMDQFSQFARRVLKPGGYCLLFTSWQKLLKWSEALEKHSFIVSKKGMTFVKKSSMLRSLTSPYFPQNAVEYGIVAQKQGGGPTRFQPPYDEPYRLVKSQHSRRFNVIDSIMPVRRKLKVPGSNNKPMRIEEKSTLLLSELLHTFCPENGLVLDCYGGTLTTALACIATDRKAIVIEKDENCYRAALKRLENVAEAKLRMLRQISGRPGDQALHEMDVLRVISNNDDENESESNGMSIDNDEAQDAIEEENFPSTVASPLDNASQNSQGDVITSDRGADSDSGNPSSTMPPLSSGEGKDVTSKHQLSNSIPRHEDT